VLARAACDVVVAAQARCVGASSPELIVRFALVQGVAGKAGDFALAAAPLKTGQERERVVLAPADADRAVLPEQAVELGIDPRRGAVCPRADAFTREQRARGGQRIAPGVSDIFGTTFCIFRLRNVSCGTSTIDSRA